jgi:uncharacterized protein (DUF305 family)
MDSGKLRSRIAAASAAAILVTAIPVAAAFGDDNTPRQSPPSASPTSPRGDSLQPMRTDPTAYEFGETLARQDGRALEVTFLAEIIFHHRSAIAMARLERARGKDPDIRTHADNIIAGQQHQVAQFTRWLREWYGLTPEQAMEQAPAEAQREMADMERESQEMLAELRAVPAGRQFDIEFVRRIIPHHNSGVIEFLEPQARAVHAQLRVAASTGIVTQESEIADFRTWMSQQSR